MKKIPQYKPREVEEEMLKVWSKENTFEASLDKTKNGEPFSFYDGPPFANGLPHFGHSLVTSIKDSIGRFQTMRGRYVERRNGWDCHGLPVEFEIEKKFNVSGKQQIMELGLEKFNKPAGIRFLLIKVIGKIFSIESVDGPIRTTPTLPSTIHMSSRSGGLLRRSTKKD